jgi:thiamine kinase-like enzyme
MATTLSAADTDRLNQALGSWRAWSPAFSQAPRWQATLGGQSNINVLVTDAPVAGGAAKGRQAVIRLHSNNAHLGVDRDAERHLQACAAQAGIAPHWLHWHPNFSVVEYVGGAHFNPRQDHHRLADIGQRIREIHQLAPNLDTAPGAQARPPLDPQQHLQDYWQMALTAPDPTQTLHARQHRALQAQIDLRLGLALEHQPAVCCHNDLAGANLLLDAKQVMVIDWEYSGAGQALFDLAVCIHSNSLDKQQATILLKAYADGLELQQVQPYLQVYAAIEALWLYLQDGNAAQLQARLARPAYSRQRSI